MAVKMFTPSQRGGAYLSALSAGAILKLERHEEYQIRALSTARKRHKWRTRHYVANTNDTTSLASRAHGAEWKGSAWRAGSDLEDRFGRWAGASSGGGSQY